MLGMEIEGGEKRSSSTAMSMILMNSISEVRAMAYSAQNHVVDARKRGKQEIMYGPYLPKEIIFNILTFVPADVILNVVRCVCRDWYDIVKDKAFSIAHRPLSSTSVVVKNRRNILYMERDSSGLKIQQLAISSAPLMGACHGLLFFFYRRNRDPSHVLNPITRAKTTLPPFSRMRMSYVRHNVFTFTSSGHCKVVYALIPYNSSEIKIWVCTLGIDKAWRLIHLGELSKAKHAVRVLKSTPYSINGFIYWIDSTALHSYAFDVDAELMHQFCTTMYNDIVDMETSLGLIKRQNAGLLWEFWELIDVKSSKWSKAFDIDMEKVNQKLQQMFHPRVYRDSSPLVYLKKGELWLLSLVDDTRTVVLLDVRNGDVLLSSVDQALQFKAYHHVNTLLSSKS